MRIVFCIAFLALAPAEAVAECGIASTYSSGTRTANGEAYNHKGISAAHKTLPFGTRVVVRNQRTGRSIVVRINDRGPFVAGRIIDLSTGAKDALGMGGLAPVCVEVISYGGKRARRRQDFAAGVSRLLGKATHRAGKIVRGTVRRTRRVIRRVVRHAVTGRVAHRRIRHRHHRKRRR